MVEKELVISRAEISRRVQELGQEITKDYENRELLVVGILKGAFVFMADLIREIDLPMQIDFIRAASYGTKNTSSGKITISKDIELAMEGKEVLLVEDIVDTGQTLAYLKNYCDKRGPLSIRICALIDKKERREVEINVDYIGFEVQSGFLVGSGLDYAEQYRNCPAVYRLTRFK